MCGDTIPHRFTETNTKASDWIVETTGVFVGIRILLSHGTCGEYVGGLSPRGRSRFVPWIGVVGTEMSPDSQAKNPNQLNRGPATGFATLARKMLHSASSPQTSFASRKQHRKLVPLIE